MAMITNTPPRILKRPKVEEKTGLTRSGIYAKLTPNPNRPNDYDPTFPKPIKLSENGRSVGWIESEIDAWIKARIEASRKVGA